MNVVSTPGVAALLLAVVAVGSLGASCGGGGSVCTDLDATVPDVDGGAACRFPCRLEVAGGSAGGDTYANFASGFFTTYCVRCHSTTRTARCFTEGSTVCRFGSPVGHNWDDPASIRKYLSKIRYVVGVGDDLTMPPDLPATPDPTKPAPTCLERYRLTRWIDAGAPGL